MNCKKCETDLTEVPLGYPFNVDGLDYANRKCPSCGTSNKQLLGGEPLKEKPPRPLYRFHCTNKNEEGEVCGEKFAIILTEFKDKIKRIAVCPKCGADVEKKLEGLLEALIDH